MQRVAHQIEVLVDAPVAVVVDRVAALSQVGGKAGRQGGVDQPAVRVARATDDGTIRKAATRDARVPVAVLVDPFAIGEAVQADRVHLAAHDEQKRDRERPHRRLRHQNSTTPASHIPAPEPVPDAEPTAHVTSPPPAAVTKRPSSASTP